jgi:serine/threonine protein kinase
MKDSLLLSEANGRDLQSYIEEHDAEIDDALRRKWSYQVAQAVAHAHQNGVVHSNLSTTNVLVHQISQSLDVLLADFGGSRCVELSLDGGLLPDDLFSDLCLLDYKSPKVNVFSLGVVLYVIMTGHYPFCNSPAPRGGERFVYSDQVRALFKKGVFPKLSSVPLGDIIARCCHERSFDTAKEVVEALEIEMSQ